MRIDFSKFTERSKAAITQAHHLTDSCNYAKVEPQVMMVSIIQNGRDMVFFLLQQMGVDQTAFCQAVSDSMGTIPHAAQETHPFSDSLERIIEKSVGVAEEYGSSVIALEHIFSAFMQVQNPVRGIMVEFGMDARKIKAAVSMFRNGNISRDEHFDHEGSSFRNLRKYARNLSVLAEEGKIEPVIGRDDEIRRILQILSRKTKNNPILVGPPGTGKTAIIEGLACRLMRGDVPHELLGLKIYALDISALLAGTSQHGEFEDRMKKVVEEAKSDPNIVLFVDEVHLLIGAGGCMNAANILKPELARGELKMIGATTVDEYVQYIESDKAFERRFQKVIVDEPDTEEALAIMRGIKQRFESFHRIKILDEAIVAAVHLSQRYISDRFLPDKAIDLIDEAAACMRIERSSVPAELDDLSRQIRCKEIERESIRQDERGNDTSELDAEIANLREKENDLNARWNNERQRMENLQSKKNELESLKSNFEQAELSGRYEEAVNIRTQMDVLSRSIEALTQEITSSDSPLLKAALDEDDIRLVITAWTGIPVQKLGEDETKKLKNLESILKQSVIGQDEAVAGVSMVIRRNRLGFGEQGKPIGSFLFLGTTGVGKTELAKTLADYLFNCGEMLVRIDMSEYQQEFSVSRLFGAPPGYVGYDQGGQLTEAVRRKPYSVILLDEIEKAHPKVFETLLQVLDDGRMTDGHGRVVDFKNTIIIMTSNLGAAALTRVLSENASSAQAIEHAKQEVLLLLKEKVAPEFINRIDEIIMFRPLGFENILKITALQLSKLRAKMGLRGTDIRFDDKAVRLVAQKGYAPEYGARPVRRAINEYIVNGITMRILGGELTKNEPILVSANDEGFIFTNAPIPQGEE